VLVAVLAINAAMFVVELAAGLWAGSTGLIADSLDMLADATVYAIALAAVGGVAVHQRRSARASGWLQLGLALLVLLDVGRRALAGAEPESAWMIAVGILALLANVTCMALLAAHRRGGMHLRASWIFTTNDVLANLGVIVAGQLVALTGSAWPDLAIGTAIAVLVASGAVRILRMAR
jgi:Co/Zn/Cd efflux system component